MSYVDSDGDGGETQTDTTVFNPVISPKNVVARLSSTL